MIVKLPDNIDYSKYTSNSGMSTRHWGPAAWSFLFTSIMSRYPFKYDKKNDEHRIVKSHFKSLLTGLKVVMPCVYCRNSFKVFLKELPIEPFLVGRMELMYWLYLMKDKVNTKLINQEKQCYIDEKKRLKQLFYTKSISEQEYYAQILKFKNENFVTVSSPPFKDVLDTYEKIRAVCSSKSLTCALPKK